MKVNWIHLSLAITILVFLVSWYFEREGIIDRTQFRTVKYICMPAVLLLSGWRYIKKQ